MIITIVGSKFLLSLAQVTHNTLTAVLMTLCVTDMFVAVLGLLLFGAVVADEPPTGTPVPTCPVYNSSSQDVPPLPKLHQQFETRLEVKYVKVCAHENMCCS